MAGITSKNHEIETLNSAFDPAHHWFDTLGYAGWTFESNNENSLPDGFFRKGDVVIWVEHTRAWPDYGIKGSRLPGKDGFKIDLQKSLKDYVQGCICCDVSSAVVNKYLSSPEYKSSFLGFVREAVSSPSHKFIFEEESIYIKYCPTESCKMDLSVYKGLRVCFSGLENIEPSPLIPHAIFEQAIKVKEEKFLKISATRAENWLFIEIPWGYFYDDNIPLTSSVFDKIFTIEFDSDDNNNACYKPTMRFPL